MIVSQLCLCLGRQQDRNETSNDRQNLSVTAHSPSSTSNHFKIQTIIVIIQPGLLLLPQIMIFYFCLRCDLTWTFEKI